MSFFTTSPRQKDLCPVCLEGFKEESDRVLGHFYGENRIVHLIHESCLEILLEKNREQNIQPLCPICELRITHVNEKRVVPFDLILAASLGRLADIKKEVPDLLAIPGEILNEAVEKAALQGHLDVLKYFISKGVEVLRAGHNRAFLFAVAGGQLEVVKYFFSDLRSTISENDLADAVVEAGSHGHLAVLKYFISKDVEVLHEGRNKAFLFAVDCNQLNIVEYFFSNLRATISEKDLLEALQRAAAKGHLELLKYLISKKVIISQKNQDKIFLLAVKEGHLNVAKYLIIKNNRRLPSREQLDLALLEAEQKGYLDVVDYFRRMIDGYNFAKRNLSCFLFWLGILIMGISVLSLAHSKQE